MREEEQLDAASVPVADVYTNVDQVVIRITEDKLRLILRDYQDGIRERSSWVAPLGIGVTVLATLTTGKANDLLLPEAWWLPVFATAGLSALLWLAVSLFRRFRRRAQHLPDIDAVVQSIKNAH